MKRGGSPPPGSPPAVSGTSFPVFMEEDFILARVIALILTEMRQPDRHTVAVIMERAQIKRGPWSVPSWRAVSVVAGEHVVGKGNGCTPIFESDDEAQYLWSGLSLALHRDL